jgi:signal transduction histidine kinase
MKYFSKLIDYFVPESIQQLPYNYDNIAFIKRYRLNITFGYVGVFLIGFMFISRYLIEGNLSKTLFVLPVVSLLFLIAMFLCKHFSSYKPLVVIFFIVGCVLLPIRIMSTGGITSAVVVWGAVAPSLFIFTSGLRLSVWFSMIYFVELFLITHHEYFNLPVLKIHPSPTTSFIVSLIGILLVMSFAVIQELTRKSHENSIKNLEKDKALNKKMISLGKMAGGIAHEVNNPLAIISGSATLINILMEKKIFKNKDKILGHLDKIQSTTKRINDIVTSLLMFAHQNTKKCFLKESFNDLITSALNIEKEKAEKLNIDFQFIEKEKVHLNCNKTQLEQLVLNLLSNSIDAIEHSDTKWIRVEVYKEEDMAILKVIDSGHGIDQDTAEKIMDPFFTTKEIGKGTGLGLSLCAGIAEQHDGRMEINHESKNTEFVVKIPAV